MVGKEEGFGSKERSRASAVQVFELQEGSKSTPNKLHLHLSFTEGLCAFCSCTLEVSHRLPDIRMGEGSN